MLKKMPTLSLEPNKGLKRCWKKSTMNTNTKTTCLADLVVKKMIQICKGLVCKNKFVICKNMENWKICSQMYKSLTLSVCREKYSSRFIPGSSLRNLTAVPDGFPELGFVLILS